MSDNNQKDTQQGSQSENQSNGGQNTGTPNQEPKPHIAPVIPFTRDELQKKSWNGFNKDDE